MVVNLIRIAVMLLAVAALGLLVGPMLILVDLVTGGTGFGLCPGGIESCELPFTAGPELLVILGLSLFAVLMVIRWLTRLARRLQQQAYAPQDELRS